jgi:hypothetical protein
LTSCSRRVTQNSSGDSHEEVSAPLLAFTALAIVSTAPAFADNLLINGSFETGDFTGWTSTDTSGYTFVTMAYYGYVPADGLYFVALGAQYEDSYISQTFTDIPGTTYALSYYYANDGYYTPPYPEDFGASIDNVTFPGSVQVQTNSNNVNILYTFTFVGTGSDTVTFNERNDPAFDALDDVSVTPFTGTPEPSSLVLLGTGALSLAGAARRKFRKA